MSLYFYVLGVILLSSIFILVTIVLPLYLWAKWCVDRQKEFLYLVCCFVYVSFVWIPFVVILSFKITQ